MQKGAVQTEEPESSACPTEGDEKPVEKGRRKLRLPSEVVYAASVLLIAVAVSMTVTAGLGVSMIVAPAYLLSEKVSFLTFGQSEYILQGVLFVGFCFAVRRFKPVYLSSFVTCLIYGAVLDLVRRVVPLFNAAATPSESLSMPARVLLLMGGMVLTSFAIALFFKVYLYPQVYDFFVIGLVTRYRLKKGLFKTGFDLLFLAVSVAMSFLFFGKIAGIGWGTLAMALCNGTLIGAFSHLFDRTVSVVPLFPRFAKLFEV